MHMNVLQQRPGMVAITSQPYQQFSEAANKVKLERKMEKELEKRNPEISDFFAKAMIFQKIREQLSNWPIALIVVNWFWIKNEDEDLYNAIFFVCIVSMIAHFVLGIYRKENVNKLKVYATEFQTVQNVFTTDVRDRLFHNVQGARS